MFQSRRYSIASPSKWFPDNHYRGMDPLYHLVPPCPVGPPWQGGNFLWGESTYTVDGDPLPPDDLPFSWDQVVRSFYGWVNLGAPGWGALRCALNDALRANNQTVLAELPPRHQVFPWTDSQGNVLERCDPIVDDLRYGYELEVSRTVNYRNVDTPDLFVEVRTTLRSISLLERGFVFDPLGYRNLGGASPQVLSQTPDQAWSRFREFNRIGVDVENQVFFTAADS